MVENTEQAQAEVNVEQADTSTQMQAAFWDDKPMATPAQEQQPAVEQTPAATPAQEPAPMVNEWWKELEFQDADTAKNEIKRLREQKPQEEIKFANDDSKRVHDLLRGGKIEDVISIYEKQKQINSVLSTEVTKDNAADVIKLGMKLKYPTLTKDQIDFQYRQEYGLPKEPVFNELKESQEEFDERHTEWKEKVSNLEMKASIAATMAKPEIEKAKAEIVLPDIQGSNQATQRQPTQEEIVAFEKQKESFLQATNLFLKDFNGFSTSVSDKDVNYAVSYGTSKEEKDFVTNAVKEFAESGFDANSLFVKEWVNKDGSLNVKQIIEDKMLLTNKEKVFQKIANDAASQRLEIYLREKKNIRIDTGAGQNFGAQDATKTQSEKLQEVFWGS
jgi:hypothetical protein